MKTPNDPLDRLFRAAARAPQEAPATVPFPLEARVLAALRQGPRPDDWFAFLPLFRGGLAVAVGVALIALAIGLRDTTPPVNEESFILDSTLELTYLP